MKIPIEISARHVHLSQKDFNALFGSGKELHAIKSLSQIGEFASKEIVKLSNEKVKLNARVVGPFRENSQIELSLTDAHFLKLNPLPQIRLSGDIHETTKILVQGPKANIKLPVIIAKRHLHCSQKDAIKLKLKNNQSIKIKAFGQRGLVFDNILVRIKPNFTTSLHLDTDEANAAGISGKTFGQIIKK